MCGGGFAKTIRDPLETAAVLAGNYLLPGSAMVTERLASKGSQKQLQSPLGRVAEFASGGAGGGVGESYTGIPSASDIGAGWGNLAQAAGLGNIGQSLGLGGEGATSTPTAVGGGTTVGAAPVPTATALPTSGTVGGAGGLGAGDLGTYDYSKILGAPATTPTGPMAYPGAGGGLYTPTPAAIPTTAPSTGILQTAINQLTGDPLKSAGLALQLAGGLQKPSTTAAQQYASLGQPMQAASNQMLAQYQSGQLTPSDQQQVANWTQGQKSAVQNYYAQAGLGNSSMMQDALARVDQQASAMRQQILNSYLANAQSAGQVAYQPLAAGISSAVSADQQAMQAQQNLARALGQFGTRTPTPTETPATA